MPPRLLPAIVTLAFLVAVDLDDALTLDWFMLAALAACHVDEQVGELTCVDRLPTFPGDANRVFLVVHRTHRHVKSQFRAFMAILGRLRWPIKPCRTGGDSDAE